jgi:signal transduction histidine kinase/CheY-like chemotaxis protein
MPRVVWAAAVLILLGGWVVVSRTSCEGAEALRAAVLRQTPTYARGLLRLEHHELTPGSTVDGAHAETITQAMLDWVEANTALQRLWTVRPDSDGGFVAVATAGRTVGGRLTTRVDGITRGANIPHIPERDSSLRLALAGNTVCGSVSLDGRAGARAVCYAPVGAPDGSIDGALIAEFDDAALALATGHEGRLQMFLIGSALAVIVIAAFAAGRVKAERRERQRATAEITTLHAQLDDAVRSAQELNLAIEEAHRVRGGFIARMSHEIRTPLTAILGYAERLRESDVEADEHREGLETIRRNGRHLLQIVNDSLDMSKIEAGKMLAERIECSPIEIAEEVAALMRIRAEEKHLTFTVSSVGPIPRVIRTDPTRLRQILINLLGNAFKFTDEGGVSLVMKLLDRPDAERPRMCFEINDTGIGMDESQLSRLFRPYAQADSSISRRYGGTGLGLSISAELASLLGGELKATSRPGQGSVFTVSIETGPLDGSRLVDRIEARDLHRPTPAAGPGETLALHGRILLAEDGIDNQRLIAMYLRKAGADVVIAENGREVLDAVRKAADDGRPVDLILMDMQMPVLSGFEATRVLREAGYAAPIVALTARAMADDRQRCLTSGCDDYAVKPIDRHALLAMCRRWLAEASSRAA